MIKEKIYKYIYLMIISLTILTLLRLILFVSYESDFSSLTTMEVIYSFLTGIRVDIVSITTSIGILVLLLFAPFKFTDNKLFLKVIYYSWFFVFSIICFIIIADIIYFQYVHRHMGNEVLAMNKDDNLLIIDMIIEYKYIMLSYLIAMYIVFKLFSNIINKEFPTQSLGYAKRFGIFLLVLIFIVANIRGKLTGKPFSIADAFVINKIASGNLALNGFYTFYRTISKKQKLYKFYPYKEALSTTKGLLKSNKFKFIDDKYPLQRQYIQKEKVKKHNVVIILLESWSSKYIDSFGNNNLKVTPNFDYLSKNGISFPNFYANGQRSIEGITAIYTGIPVLTEFHSLGKGLELSNLSYIGNIAKANNYSTIAMQSSKGSSFRVGEISKIAGFDEYYGAEDMPLLGDEDKNKKPKFGTWDGNMFKFLNFKLKTMKEPFLSFAFTATTHAPFVSPGQRWEPYPHDKINIFGFLNTLNYSDDMLGEFMESAKKEPWFDNTIFILTADHTIGFGNDKNMFKNTNIKIENRDLENQRIPLVIYAPKILKPKIIKKIGSQVDIIPTIIDLLSWNASIGTLSNSLFDDSSNGFVLFSNSQYFGMVDNSGYVTHNLKNKLESTSNENIEKKALSIYQVSSKLLRANILYKEMK
ncbi:MAG TPA: LTA synthase family protein [Arcobacter sp.]|nr:LTA synthase family protein [Arcobacter sp.]